MKKLPVAIVLVLLAALLLAACGGGSSSSEPTGAAEPTTEESGGGEGAEGGEAGGGGAGGSLSFEAASSGFEYTSNSASAEAGKVTVDFNNPQGIGHDVAIETSGGEVVGQTEIVTEGESSTTVELKPGTYTFFCSVPGHREAGMEGTLTVK